jgi:hypothetical protein
MNAAAIPSFANSIVVAFTAWMGAAGKRFKICTEPLRLINVIRAHPSEDTSALWVSQSEHY